MIHKTDDLPGDICNHARSVIIQDVSQVTLEKFMAEFNEVVGKAVLQRGDVFYEDRGATVHTVEVRSIHCKDPATEKVLQVRRLVWFLIHFRKLSKRPLIV